MEAELLNSLPRMVDPLIGLIRGVHELPVHRGEPSLFVVLAEFQNPYRFPPFGGKVSDAQRRKDYYASGAGLSRGSALQAAIGEALERYCAQTWEQERIIVATADDLGATAVDVNDIIQYSAEQYGQPKFPFRPFRRDAPYRWIDGLDLHEGRSVLLPAALAIMGFGAINGGHDRELGSCTSSGMAAGRSFEQATLSALLELIERDAFMVHWYARQTPRRIHTSAVSQALPRLASELIVALGDGCAFLDITTDLGIPCALALCPHPKGFGLAMGASCRLTYATAAEKALLEAAQCMLWILDSERSGVRPCREEDIRDFTDHVRFYLDPANHCHAAFLTQGERSCEWAPSLGSSIDSRTSLSLVLDALARNGLKAYAVDMTPEDVRDLGFTCVRALVPGLQPLYCGYRNQHLDPRRVSRFSEHRGDANFEWNLSPHPFP